MSPLPTHPRIAYFPDSFHELNGVAHTSRNFAAYAQRHAIPMLCVRAGQTTQRCPPNGTVEALELGRSALAVQLERDLYFDPLFFRYSALISQTVRAFKPDVIHITGPSELGIFGAYFAWKLGIPLVASWHTNVHEYGARRLQWLTRHLGNLGRGIERTTESGILEASARFYHLAKVLYAPNPELCTLLERKTSQPCHLMERGVETDLFTPAKRTRPPFDLPDPRNLASGSSHQESVTQPVLGYVGRLSVEKNVELLPTIDAALRQRGITAKWVIIGHGSEEPMLRAALGNAAMLGVLRGEALAKAYANMDLFVFPSHTDTFGNVVLEALASGVPAIVTPDGGPAHIVHDYRTGRIARDEDFATAITETLLTADNLAPMQQAARAHALQCSWDAVFDRVVAAYPLT